MEGLLCELMNEDVIVPSYLFLSVITLEQQKQCMFFFFCLLQNQACYMSVYVFFNMHMAKCNGLASTCKKYCFVIVGYSWLYIRAISTTWGMGHSSALQWRNHLLSQSKSNLYVGKTLHSWYILHCSGKVPGALCHSIFIAAWFT